MTSKTHRLVVVTRFPTSVVALLKYTQALIAALTNNTHFTDAAAVLAALQGAFTMLDTSETTAKTRAIGTVAARDNAKNALLTQLHGAKAYVQQKADANPEQAQAIIESAGMAVRKTPIRVKLGFTVKPGPVTGSVHLSARSAARRASYEWEWSADGGKTWTLLPSTLQAKTTVPNLPVGTSCSFRFRPVTKTGEADWSQVVTMLVK
ncbi:MAG TPA: hypothetical protein VF765_27480 [Polyangiaceae bacterium]